MLGTRHWRSKTKIATLYIYVVYKENILNGVCRYLKTCIPLGRVHILGYYSFLNTILYLVSQISMGSVDRNQGDSNLGWRKKYFILTNNKYLAFSSSNECRQRITALLASTCDFAINKSVSYHIIAVADILKYPLC